MSIKTKILGTFSILLAFALLFQATSYYLTKRSVTYLTLIRGEINERRLTLEAKRLFTQKVLAVSNCCLYPRKEYMDQVLYADKAFVNKLGELEKQLRVCGDPGQLALLRGIMDHDKDHNRGIAQYYEIHTGTITRSAGLDRINNTEKAEAAVMSGFEDMGKETLGMIKAGKEGLSLHDRLRWLFPSFAPIISSRDKLLDSVNDPWTDIELDSIANLRAIASRRFLLTGDKKYISWHNALEEAFDAKIANNTARQAKEDLAGTTAFADAKDFNGEVEAAFDETTRGYRSGNLQGAEKSLLHSILTEQMLDSTLEDRYDSDLHGFETAYASLIPVTQYAVSFNRQMLGVIASVALLVFITGYFLINRMIKPINDLKDASRSISEGDWSQRVPVRAHDEIGKMAESFNRMTAHLEKAEKELRKNHWEMSALHTVSTTVSQTFEMEELCDEVLAAVSSLGVLEVGEAAGVFLVEGDGMRLVSYFGHTDGFLDLHKDLKVGDCLCGQAAKTGKVIISPDSSKDDMHSITCPGIPPHGHIIVPLKAKDKVTGVMFIYTPVGAAVETDETNLLTSIGNQLGMALDNARLYKETKELALRDPLTGLANRRLMEVLLEKNFASAKRLETSLSVIMADIDYFKKFNDTYGHPGGDALLVCIARKIVMQTRDMDLVVRYGGEEFFILLPDAGLPQAQIVAERIRAAVESGSLVTISLGVAPFDPAMNSYEELIKAADTALYNAKKAGRNRVVAFDRAQVRAA